MLKAVCFTFVQDGFYSLAYWSSNLSLSHNQLKTQISGLHPRFLIQQVWAGAKNVHVNKLPNAAVAAGTGTTTF